MSRHGTTDARARRRADTGGHGGPCPRLARTHSNKYIYYAKCDIHRLTPTLHATLRRLAAPRALPPPAASSETRSAQCDSRWVGGNKCRLRNTVLQCYCAWWEVRVVWRSVRRLRGRRGGRTRSAGGRGRARGGSSYHLPGWATRSSWGFDFSHPLFCNTNARRRKKGMENIIEYQNFYSILSASLVTLNVMSGAEQTS